MKNTHIGTLIILVLLIAGLQLTGCVTTTEATKAEDAQQQAIAELQEKNGILERQLIKSQNAVLAAETAVAEAEKNQGHEATIADFKAARLAAEKARAEFSAVVNDFLTTDPEVTVEALKKLGLDPTALKKLQKQAAAARIQRQKEAAAGFPQSSGNKQ
jgi:hypothetical protein